MDDLAKTEMRGENGRMLSQKHCVPCEGGVDPFTSEQIQTYLPLVPGWAPVNNLSLARECSFKNFKEALACINNVGEISESEGHHPDINLHNWNKVTFTLSTHAIKGLSENDFIMAAKINSILTTTYSISTYPLRTPSEE